MKLFFRIDILEKLSHLFLVGNPGQDHGSEDLFAPDGGNMAAFQGIGVILFNIIGTGIR